MLTRREFLHTSSLLALAPAVPLFVTRTARAAIADRDRRLLIIVQLDGGNDALNTVVPFADPLYEKLRPKLQLARKDLVRLSETVGLNPSLKSLDKLLQAGNLAVIPGVGYPNPNRSHMESMAIWHTARFDPTERKGYGWVGRALDTQRSSSFTIGGAVPGAVRGRRSSAVALGQVEDLFFADPRTAQQAIGPETDEDLLAFVRRQAVDARRTADQLAKLARTEGRSHYPGTPLAERLKLVACFLKLDLGARVFYTFQPGYDTHATQSFTHGNLLSEFSEAVAAFFADLAEARLAERVTLLAFSEFGRTIKENGSTGTDHGTAGAVLLAGPGVHGGVIGAMPDLTDLVEGEPKMTTDFRGVYAAVLEDWLGLPSEAVLAGTFARPALFRG
jgi:uncharacterized protein (DUF1501 family)